MPTLALSLRFFAEIASDCIGRGMDRIGHAGGFAPEQQDVVAVTVIEIGGRGTRREQHERQLLGPPPRVERSP